MRYFLILLLVVPAVAADTTMILDGILPLQESRTLQELISLDKQTFVVGESIAITIIEDPETLTITGPDTNYKYLGTPYNPLIFIPQVAGKYTITAIVNGYEDRESFTVIDGTPPDQHEVINIEGSDDPIISFVDDEGRVLIRKTRSSLETSLAYSVIKEENQELTAIIEPRDNLFSKIVIRGVKAREFSLGIDTPPKVNVARDKELRGKRLVAEYAVDPSAMNFTDGELTRTAQGTELYKCAEWNFANQRCDGTWQKYLDIEPGKEYRVPIAPVDPAFVEVSVATVNAKKPIYKPGEEAQLLMAVLDEKGMLVSGADVTLSITAPSGRITTLTSAADDIREVSNGIYEARHTSTEEGLHELFVQAGAVVMTSSYTVAELYAYDIVRESPMSIDPWKGSHETTLIVLPESAGAGTITITERVPQAINITDAGGAALTHQANATLLTWTVPTGVPVSYLAQAPLVTPDLYALGPARVLYGQSIFDEARPWWLAIDPTNTLDPIVNANTALDGTPLTAGQVADISTDNTAYVTFPKSSILRVELSNPTNTTPIVSVQNLSCFVTYTSEVYDPAATFRVDDAVGGNVLGTRTLPASAGGDTTLSLPNLHLNGNFNIADLTTLNVFIQNNDGGKSQSISIDDVWCSVAYTQADLTAPTVSLQKPDSPSYLGNPTIQFNYTPSDNVGFSSCRLLINGTLNETNSTPIVNATQNSITESFGDGYYNWTVQCTDTSNNNGTGSPVRDFAVDTTAPAAFSLTAPTNGTVSTNLLPTFSWTATSDLTFLNYTLLLDDSPAFSSPNYVRGRTLTPTNNSFTFTTVIASNTLYYWKVIAWDRTNHQTQSTQIYQYTTDTIAPTAITLTSPASGTISTSRTPFLDWSTTTETNFANYTVQFDNNPGFTSVDYTYTQTNRTNSQYQVLVGEQLGANTLYYWRVIAYDRAGQSATSGTRNYTTDNTGPSITLQAPVPNANETITNTVQFNYTVTDAVSGVASCELIVNGTSQQTDPTITEGVTQTFEQFLNNGYYEWWVNCTDAPGNENTSSHRFLNVSVTVDTTPPVITLNYPGNTDYVNTSTIAFNFTPQDATGILNCSLFVDGLFASTNTSPVIDNAPNDISAGPYGNGGHNWSVSCYDNSTNENQGFSDTYTFTIDTTPPTAFSLLSPANATATNDNTQLLTWAQTTESNFANYTVQLDNNADFTSPEYEYYNASITGTSVMTTALADGTYYWRVIAYDLASNSRISTQTYVLTIHTQAPQYANVTESPIDPVEYAPRIYNFTIDIDEPEIDTVLFEHSFGGPYVNVTPNSSGNTYWFVRSGLNVNTYGYQWFMNDTFGNVNQTPQYSYQVTKNTTTVNLYLAGAQNNITINESTIVNITGLLNWPTTGVVTLRQNGSILNSSTSPVYRLRNFTIPGYFVINASYAGSSNYKASSKRLYVTVLDNINPVVTQTTPFNATTDDDGIISYGFNVTDSNTMANCSLYVNGALNDTIYSPTKGTELFFNKVYDVDQNLTWAVQCYDVSGRSGTSETRNLTIDIAIYSLNLVPAVCSDFDGCTVSNINQSDTNWESHGSLQKAPTQNNYVYANVTNPNIPLGSEILNASIYWKKYQDTADGTFFLYWRNGSNWAQICSKAFVVSSTASPDSLSCTLPVFPNVSTWNEPLQLRANFLYTGNPSGKLFGTEYVEVNVTYQEDTTDPTIVLEEPPDGDERGSGLTQFNITATDTNLENCTLWGDFGGSWAANSTITIANNLTSGSKSSFLPVNLEVGYYTWNARCVDIANNVAFASQNFSVNITPPDLIVQDIFFPAGVIENTIITLFADIYNQGFTTAENFIVQFFLGDPDLGGSQINGNRSVSSLAYQENVTVNVSYLAPIGPSQIFVVVDGNDSVIETDETNNERNETLNVNAYSRVYGNTTLNLTLDIADNSTLISFATKTNNTGNLFFARGGSSISFQKLVPLGKTSTDLNTGDDFSNADVLLNMTGFNDSVNAVWANNTDTPLNTTTFTISQQTIDEVPFIASDTDADFVTGILWDSDDDIGPDLEYDVGDAEDLVFIANMVSDKVGTFGIQDYEAVIPARLREYAGGPVEMVEIYFELT